MQKVTKISKVLNTIIGICRIILKVAAIVSAVAVCILLFIPKHSDIWQSIGYTIQLGEVTLELIPDGMIAPESARLFSIGSVALSVLLFLFAAKWLHIVQGILTPMSQGKPFDRNVSTSLRKLSFITLIIGGIGEAVNMGFFALQLRNFNLDALFNPALVAGYTVEMKMDMNFLLIFGILLLLSHVFRYGEELQTLSDETL